MESTNAQPQRRALPNGETVYRIQARRDIISYGVTAGDLGGFIEVSWGILLVNAAPTDTGAVYQRCRH